MRYRLRLSVVLLFFAAASAAPGILLAAPPQVADPRLKIDLFAESPQIVTPIGVAVDAKGRVLVVESHTHFRPPGYKGPDGRSDSDVRGHQRRRPGRSDHDVLRGHQLDDECGRVSRRLGVCRHAE